MKRPNVLLLMVDQHNAKCLGCYGHDTVRTPNLDKLAKSGVKFTSAFVQSPICSPSRMCYMTSQYAHNHGYFGLRGPLPQQLPNMVSQFKDNGYFTGAIGKVHLPENWIEKSCDYFCEAVFGRMNCQGEDYVDFMKRHGIDEPEDEVTLERLAKGFFLESVDGRPDFLPKELSREGFAVTKVEQFLEKKPEDQPFFLWFSLSKPHPEYKPAQEFWDLYPEQMPMPETSECEPEEKLYHLRETWRKQRENPPADMPPGDYNSLRNRTLRGYYGNISHTDWTMGQVLDLVEKNGLSDDTIVIYCADHGDFACEFGLLEKAPGISTDAVCRIPFIWSWPGHIPEGQSRDHLVQTVDVWPTLANLTGLPEMNMWDGADISEILTDDCAGIHKAVFTENPFIKSVTTDKWRLTYIPNEMFPDDHIRGELYDRINDPLERKNLYHDPEFANVVVELKQRIFDWLITSNHPISALPVLPHPSLDWTVDDPFNDNKPYPEDGRTSPKQIRDTLRNGIPYYL